MSGDFRSSATYLLSKVAFGTLASLALLGGAALIIPSMAFAGSTNTITFKGANPGSLKTSGSQDDCTFGKTYNGKGYLVSIGHMTGSISGAGKGMWAMTLYVPKMGTTKVTKADVTSLTDSSLQNSVSPFTQFVETSGSITYNGSKGSLDLTVEYHKVGSSTYGKSSTVTGSWSCQ